MILSVIPFTRRVLWYGIEGVCCGRMIFSADKGVIILYSKNMAASEYLYFPTYLYRTRISVSF